MWKEAALISFGGCFFLCFFGCAYLCLLVLMEMPCWWEMCWILDVGCWWMV